MSNATEHHPDLQRLLDEREIHRLLMNYCRGLDRLDEELLCSVYHPDAYDDHGAVFRGNAHDYARDVVKRLARLDRTMHCVSNVIVDVDGDVAYVESYLLAYHCASPEARELPAGSPGAGVDYLVGGRYVDRCERRDGAWRIARREMIREFRRSDPIGAELPAADDHPRALRSREDRAYGRD